MGNDCIGYIEEIAQYEAELASEEFHCKQLLIQKQRAFIGIGLDLVCIIFAFLCAYWLSGGAFGAVVGLVLFAFAIIASIKLTKDAIGEIKKLVKRYYTIEYEKSVKRQDNLKKLIQEKNIEIRNMKIPYFRG